MIIIIPASRISCLASSVNFIRPGIGETGPGEENWGIASQCTLGLTGYLKIRIEYEIARVLVCDS